MSGYLRGRVFADRLLASVALVILSPVMAITALLVRFDNGAPVIFWQKRVGKGGREILVHKFRTLKAPIGPGGRVLTDAERLSRVGLFLRKTRLDELPQLFDILRGHMSFIGPRPLLPVDIVEGAALRHAIPPGITGWAQVHGGNLVTDVEKNALDEWYVQNATLVVDVKILWQTVRLVFGGERRSDGVIAAAMALKAQTQTPAAGRPKSRSRSRGLRRG